MTDTRLPPMFLAESRGLDFPNTLAVPVDTQFEWLASGEDLLLARDEAFGQIVLRGKNPSSDQARVLAFVPQRRWQSPDKLAVRGNRAMQAALRMRRAASARS